MDEQDQGTVLMGGQDQDTSWQVNDQGAAQQYDVWAEDKVDGVQEIQSAPEAYEFSTPEGAVDEMVMEAYSDVAKELNLPQDQAQMLIDRMLPVMQTQQQQVLSQACEDWALAARSDREFGGERLGENLSIAKKAMETFGSPELQTLLDASGLGNHPEIIRAFYRAGKTLHQDNIVTGGRGVLDNSMPMEKKLYPNM